jgi:hypothetical protein
MTTLPIVFSWVYYIIRHVAYFSSCDCSRKPRFSTMNLACCFGNIVATFSPDRSRLWRHLVLFDLFEGEADRCHDRPPAVLPAVCAENRSTVRFSTPGWAGLCHPIQRAWEWRLPSVTAHRAADNSHRIFFFQRQSPRAPGVAACPLRGSLAGRIACVPLSRSVGAAPLLRRTAGIWCRRPAMARTHSSITGGRSRLSGRPPASLPHRRLALCFREGFP